MSGADGPDVRALAFDWGGVFTEGTFDSGAVRDLAELYAVPEARVAEAYYPLMAEFEVGALDLGQFQRRLEDRTALSARAQAFRAAFLGAIRWRAWMLELLARVPDSYAVGMLSNNVPVLCQRVRTEPRLQRIEHFVFSNEIGIRKPDARAFAALEAALGVAPRETVFVDDNPENVEAACHLGYRGLLLDTPAAFAARWRETVPSVAAPAEPA